jgi:hypothetical protein
MWDAALASLAQGGHILWRGISLTLAVHEPGESAVAGPTLFIRVGTAWEPDHMTPGRAEAELLHARGAIAELAGESEEFAELIAGRTVSYELLHDHGTGAVRLATWTDTGFTFEWR